MTEPAISAPGIEPVERRLHALGQLDRHEVAALHEAYALARTAKPHAELLCEGQVIETRSLLVSGWAARTRVLEDGRRQILNFTLPGDLIGNCDQERPVASSTVVSLTPVTWCPAPDPENRPGLARAYAMSRALEEAHLFSQITRLGRMSAQERIEDLLLELLERLELAGLAFLGRYRIPITQEVLADCLGLTSVHINRTLQLLRQSGRLTWARGMLIVADPDAMRRKLNRPRTRVTLPPDQR